RGENFTEESVVRWKGKDLPTKFLSSTELEVELPAEALARPGEIKLTVFTPGPRGGSSQPATLVVTSP
ncbi:MAG: IPT/TIG domain-containing protein, partial [Candidatus Acidiferrales bacterium]